MVPQSPATDSRRRCNEEQWTERAADERASRERSAPLTPKLDDALADLRSREWLRVALSSIGEGVITTDNQARVALLNPVAQQLTGWTQEEAVSVELERIFHIVDEETRAEMEPPALRALREGVVVGLGNQALLIARDGTERSIENSAAPIRNDKGEVAGCVLVFRDITDRVQAQETLRDSEVRYRRLFQTAKDGILILDGHTGKILDANAFMSGLLGQEPHEFKGKELWEIGLFKDIEENKRAFQELQEKRYVRYEHLPVKKPSGEVTQVEFVSNIYAEGDRLMAQCTVRDISERWRMERQLRQQAEQLADQHRRKDEFLAMLGHELRNPLAPILSATHLLKLQQRGGENSIQQHAREVIDRQVATLTRLVGDLLEVSRVVTGRIRLDKQTVDMNQVMERAIETVEPLIKRRGHALMLRPSTEPVCADVDPTRMEEVLVNLLTNAAKYTDSPGQIEMGCERHEDQVLVRVRDNGAGIVPDLLEGGRIFDIFAQGERTLDRSEGGLGVGLSLAHRLVEMHGGMMEAHSEGPGTGSEFVVRLPLSRCAHPPSTAPPASEGGGAKGLRVLVVDDNVDACEMLAQIVRLQECGVQTAHTGNDALAVALVWRPDVVLLDIGLPGIDGYEVARRLRADSATKNIKLIAVSGYGTEKDIQIGREAGFDLHILKPAEPAEVEKLLSACNVPPRHAARARSPLF